MSYENILTLLETLPAEQADFKSKLVGFVKELNQDRGKASADILRFKKELEELKNKPDPDKQVAKYKEVAEALAKAGIDAKNADELMKKLDIKKSIEDENTILKTNLEQLNEKLQGFETKEQFNQRMEKVNPLFSDALTDFVKAKQAAGDPNYMLTDHFVDKETLYKEIDVNNDTLRNDHFTKVLKEADMAQQKFKESTGMDFTKQVHNQNLAQGHYQNTNGINNVTNAALAKVQESKGSMESVVQGLSEIMAAQENS